MINGFLELLYFLLNYSFTYNAHQLLKGESNKKGVFCVSLQDTFNRASSCNIIYVFKNIFVIQIYFYIVTIIRKS